MLGICSIIGQEINNKYGIQLKYTLRLPIKSIIMPGWPGSVVICINIHINQPAVTIANAVRNDRVNARGDNNCFK